MSLLQRHIVLARSGCLVVVAVNHRFCGQWDAIWLEQLGLYSLYILLHISIFFRFACPQLVLRSISSFLFFSIFLFCRWNLFPMAIFHLGLILPLVAVCECFQCSFLFLTSYVIDSLSFFFPFYLCDCCFFLIETQCGFYKVTKKQIQVMHSLTLMLVLKLQLFT